MIEIIALILFVIFIIGIGMAWAKVILYIMLMPLKLIWAIIKPIVKFISFPIRLIFKRNRKDLDVNIQDRTIQEQGKL